MCVSSSRPQSFHSGFAVNPSAAMRFSPNRNHAQSQIHKDQSKMVEIVSSGTTQETACQAKEKFFQPIIVQHTYLDHSNDQTFMVSAADLRKNRGGVAAPFPLKLHDMLASVESEGYDDVVSWQPHGRCFKIHKPDEFKTVILPKYFPNLSKMASFQRQLNLYGFKRLAKHDSLDRAAYYHELFLRGRNDLANAIQRTKVKGTGIRARSNPEQEPNFWSMPWVNDSKKVNKSLPGLSAQNPISSQDAIKEQTVEPIRVLSSSNTPGTSSISQHDTFEPFSYERQRVSPSYESCNEEMVLKCAIQKPTLYQPMFPDAPSPCVPRKVSTVSIPEEEINFLKEEFFNSCSRRNSLCTRRNSLHEYDYTSARQSAVVTADGNHLLEGDLELNDFDFDKLVAGMFDQEDDDADFEALLVKAIV